MDFIYDFQNICNNAFMGIYHLTQNLSRTLDVDDPHATVFRRKIIQEKSFLRNIYLEWYSKIKKVLPAVDGPLLELGSGPGFLADYIDNLISSEIFYIPGVKVILDGQKLPCKNNCLRGIVMTDVFHHIPSVKDFFSEAARCIKPGGVLTMIEPWNTPWAKFIYTNFHSEPFLTEVKNWDFQTSGPLSGSNQALPWIVFQRDRDIFNVTFPEWQTPIIEPFIPLRYLLSGGVSRNSLVPGFSYPFWKKFEKLLTPWMNNLAMFAQITLYRK